MVTDIQGVGCGCGGGQERHLRYDQFLRKTSEWVGSEAARATTWTYGRDQTIPRPGGFTELVAAYPSPSAKAEPLSSTDTRTTQWTYYPTSDPLRRSLVNVETLPSVANPGQSRTTTWTYDAQGLLVSRTESGYVGSTLSTSTTSFSNDTKGRLRTVDGPRTITPNDLTTYDYFADDDSDLAKRGQLKSVTDALGNVTMYAQGPVGTDTHDLFGNPKSVTDPNGIVTTMLYDNRGRLTTRTLEGLQGDNVDLVTTTTYDDAGRLTRTQLPLGNARAYVYDESNRLTDTIVVAAGGNEVERLHLKYNTMSQKTKEEYQHCATPAAPCASWLTDRSDDFAYDTYGRLWTITHPDAKLIAYGYDGFGNLFTVQDENHTAANTTYGYDWAHRLLSVTQTLDTGSVVTGYTYDLHDNLATVTDPNTNETTFGWDDFRRMGTQTSPVSGTTTYGYDEAGNLTTSTDANGATTARTYDALNRVLSAISTRSGYATETVTYAYDETRPGWNGRGRLKSMSDPAGTTYYRYDRRGLLVEERRATSNHTFVTGYAYDGNGNRTGITYPSGAAVATTFDAADRPVGASRGGAALASSGGYAPWGPLTSLTWGNAATWSFGVTNRYQPSTLAVNGTPSTVSYTYARDDVGNITGIADDSDSGYNRTFSYDDLGRLRTTDSGASLWGSGGTSYDGMGNITSMVLGATERTFTYVTPTPKLASVTEPAPIGTRSVTYDAAGNESAIGTSTYVYSSRNYLASGDGLGYRYDGRGVRTDLAQAFAVGIGGLSPSSAQVGGGQFTLTVTGSGYTPASVVRWNGVARSTTYQSATQLAAAIPATDLAAAATAVVTVAEGTSVSNPAPFIVSFADVTPAHALYDWVNMMVEHGVTAGCGSGNYCPNNPVTREQMAIFLLKAKHGPTWTPPACVGIFADVPCPGGFAVDWIEALYNEGITGGCGGGNYCPTSAVTRAQMAVFLLRSKEGSSAVPPACWGLFGDVSCPSGFAVNWIEELARRDITAGCGGGNYCPTSSVTRGQMAVFIART